MVKRLLIFVNIVMLMFVTGCDLSDVSDRFSNDSNESSEYDYREMYLNNDSKDLTDKDLEVFNEACRVYSLYIDSCDTDYEKVVAAHDYIIKNCVYNKSAIENDTLIDDDFHPYGVFVKGIAVCEGYAKAFKMLMDIAGIDCMLVTGTVGEDQVAHAWNMVKLENDWYHVDVTFDDPNPETEEIVYVYLNITDEEISKDHTWNKNITPEADADKYDYIKNSGNIFDTVDDITSAISQCNINKKTYLSFVWSQHDMVSDDVWRQALKGTNISNLLYSCVGVPGRRMYMITFTY
ncbi:MAG: hypothetical protein IJP13_02275 [Lachnospiraceae bacterium]|nr:hypothetical protein [Lachnospiraceae bacterium]